MSWHAIPVVPGLDAELSIRFDGTNWVDVTPDLRTFSTDIPRSRVVGMWSPGKASFSLDNRTGKYTPLNTSGAYYGDLLPGRHIRYRERFASVVYDVWYGIIEDWGDQYPQARDGIATVSAYQPTALLARFYQEPRTPVGEGEAAGARIGRILTAAAWPLGSSLADGLAPLQALAWGHDALTAVDSAVRTDLGGAWCDTDGDLVFEDRYSLVNNTRSNTSQATFGPGNVRYHGEPTMSSGLDLTINQYIAANVGQSARVSINTTSVANLDQTFAASDLRLIGTDPNFAEGNAEAMTRLYANPLQHPRSIRLILAANSTEPPQALGRRIRDKVTVIVPTPWGTSITSTAWVVGISHSGSAQAGRETVLHLEPAGNFAGLALFRLDTSALDGPHILGW